MEIQVNPDIFNETYYKALYNNLQATNYIYGGSSSGKTYGITQFMVLEALGGRACLAVRESQAQLRSTLFLEIINAIWAMGLTNKFEQNISQMTFKSRISTGEIACVGTDRNAEKIKGIRTSNGAGGFSLAFADELSGISRYAWVQLKLRMRGDHNYPTQRIGSFNPISIEHYLFQDEILPTGFDPYAVDHDDWEFTYIDEGEPANNVYILRTNYLNNDRLDQDTIDNLESLANDSKYFEQVYLKAEPGTMGDLVYPEVHMVKELPKNVLSLPIRVGIDNGWKDLMCMTICAYDKHDNSIYVIDSLAMNKTEPEVFAKHAIPVLEKYGIRRNKYMLADSNNPLVNIQLKKAGLGGVKSAKKGPGSKLAGILWLKTRKIYCPEYLKGMVSAFGSYVWDENKDDTKHEGSDRLDAMRYAFEDDFRAKSRPRDATIKFNRGKR